MLWPNWWRAASVEAALVDPQVEAVAIATPPRSHADLARIALSNGKHVFVEKPITMNAAEGAELVEIAEKAGLRLMVGHILRYHAAFRALQAFLASGRIGAIRHISCLRLGFGAIRRFEDVIWCLAPHDLSMILALTGEMPAGIEASAVPILRPNIADMAEIGLVFPSGVTAKVSVSWLNPFKEHRMTVIGEKGMAVFEDSAADPQRKLRHYPHDIDWSSGAPRAAPAQAYEPIAYEPAEPLKAECRHFLDCVRTGVAPLTDGQEALRIMRIMEVARDKAYANLPLAQSAPTAN
jgi:UDP-2-acetamido-3-amino-2,3-dideoxy-glucuronate N-acetyltransferase